MERDVDVALAVRIMMRAMGNKPSRQDRIIVASGDSDLAFALEEAERCLGRGSVVVIGGRDSVSNELKQNSMLQRAGGGLGPCLYLDDLFESVLKVTSTQLIHVNSSPPLSLISELSLESSSIVVVAVQRASSATNLKMQILR